MSKITLTPNASGTGTFTIQSPATDTNRTFTLPDEDGELSVGGGAGSNEFVATGAIPNGAVVSLNSDGTVSVAKSPTPEVGVRFEASSATDTRQNRVAVDPNTGKIVVLYIKSNDLFAVVGTVSGASLTFGSPVTIDTENTYDAAIAFDPDNNKFLCVWSGVKGKAAVGTVSGTSISFGSTNTWQSSNSYKNNLELAYDENANKFVFVFYRTDTSSAGANLRLITVSGTTCSVTSEQSYANNVYRPNVVFDPVSQKIVIFYTSTSYDARIAVLTVSGSSASLGTSVDLNAFATDDEVESCSIHCSSGNNAIFYSDRQNTYFRTFTISGTSISLGTELIFEEGVEYEPRGLYYDSTLGEYIAVYIDEDVNKIYARNFFVSGGLITLRPEYELGGKDDSQSSSAYDPISGYIVVTTRGVSNSMGVASLYNPLGNYGKVIGFADEAISDGSTGSVTTVGGINETQSGLQVGEKYYLQSDETINFAPETNDVIGLSLSATKMLKL